MNSNRHSLYSAVFVILLSIFSINAHGKLQVFTCEPEWQALVENLGGEHVTAVSATTAFQDPHYIEARPSLIVKVRKADLLVCTGAELEIGWLPLLLRKSGNANVQLSQPGSFMAADFVERLEIPHRHDRSDGDVHASGNPHVHLDPHRLLTIAEALSKRLIQLDPTNKDDYQTALHKFKRTWSQRIKEWENKLQSLSDEYFIVHHRNWSYLFNWLSLKELADLEPKPGIPPSSSHLLSLLEKVENKQAKGILISNYQNPKAAQWLSERTGLPVITLPFTVGADDSIQTLENLFDAITDRLVANSAGQHD